jgi:hypothetical protein
VVNAKSKSKNSSLANISKKNFVTCHPTIASVMKNAPKHFSVVIIVPRNAECLVPSTVML